MKIYSTKERKIAKRVASKGLSKRKNCKIKSTTIKIATKIPLLTAIRNAGVPSFFPLTSSAPKKNIKVKKEAIPQKTERKKAVTAITFCPPNGSKFWIVV